MADDTTAIDLLKAQIVQLNNEAKKRRLANNGLTAENTRLAKEVAALTTDRDGLKAKAATPPNEGEEVKGLKAKLLDRDHRDAWKEIQADPETGLNPKVPVEKVWAILGYKPDGEANPGAIRALLLKAKETDAYLFVEPEGDGDGEAETDPAAPIKLAPTKPLPAGGPGGGKPAFTPTQAQMRDPRWMHENQHRFATPKEESRGY